MINELNESQTLIQRGDTHMTSTLRGSEGVKAKMRCYRMYGVRGWRKGGWRVFWASNLFILLLIKIGFAP